MVSPRFDGAREIVFDLTVEKGLTEVSPTDSVCAQFLELQGRLLG